jgi:hypothetical protein
VPTSAPVPPAAHRLAWLLLLTLATALALASTATARIDPGAARLQAPRAAELARANELIRDAAVGRLALPPARWGGPYTASTGETVTVYASDTYPVDPAIGQRWADFLGRLSHGSELTSLTAYLAPLDEVQTFCGFQALACYSPGQSLLVAPGDDPAADLSAEAVVAHEYGHHVAAHRSNSPWLAVDWGTKRWATAEQVCARTRAAQLFPGAEDDEHYELNPGEGFAESYRVFNQRRLGQVEAPWEVVSRALFPSAAALAGLELDVTQPWTGNTASSLASSLPSRARASRSFAVATPLDGTLRLTLRAPRAARFALQLWRGSTRVGRAVAAGGRAASVGTTVCGTRSYGVRVARLAGGGAFRVAVSKP